MDELSPEEFFPYADRVRAAYAGASNEALQEEWLKAFLTGTILRFRGDGGVDIHLIPHESTAFRCLVSSKHRWMPTVPRGRGFRSLSC